MSKCVVTKLQASINNPDLERFGCIRIDVDATETNTYTYLGINPVSVKYTEGDIHYNKSTKMVANGDLGYMWIDKRALTTLPIVKGAYNKTVLNLDQLKSVNTITQIGASISLIDCYVIGDLSSLENKSLTTFCISNKIQSESDGVSGDIAVFAEMPLIDIHIRGHKVVGNIANLNIESLKNCSIFGGTDIEGTVEDLNLAKNLVKLNVYSNNKLTGNIDNLFTAWSTAGKTSSCTVTFGGTDIHSNVVRKIFTGTTVYFDGNGHWGLTPYE